LFIQASILPISFYSSACPVAAQQKWPQPAAQGCPDILFALGKTTVPIDMAGSDATSVATDALSSSCSFAGSKGLLLATEWPRVSFDVAGDGIDISTIGRFM
jgi:hypothetical protein